MIKKILNWIASLFGLIVVEANYQEVLNEKIKKINQYRKLYKQFEVNFQVSQQILMETKNELEATQAKTKYMIKMTDNFDKLETLIWGHNVSILSGVISEVQSDLILSSTIKNITPEELQYRMWAIDILSTLLQKIYDLKNIVDQNNINKNIPN